VRHRTEEEREVKRPSLEFSAFALRLRKMIVPTLSCVAIKVATAIPVATF
jgi:hypothetical protein